MSFRRVLTVLALAVVAVVFVGQIRKLLADPSIWPPDDFIEYWAAAKLTLDGQNPYDANLLLPLQQANGRDDRRSGDDVEPAVVARGRAAARSRPGTRSATPVAGGELRGDALLRRPALAAPRRHARAALGRLGDRARRHADAVRAAIGADRPAAPPRRGAVPRMRAPRLALRRRGRDGAARDQAAPGVPRLGRDPLRRDRARPVAHRARRSGRGAGMRRDAAARSTRTSGSSTPTRWRTGRRRSGSRRRSARCYGSRSAKNGSGLQFVPMVVGPRVVRVALAEDEGDGTGANNCRCCCSCRS